MAVSDSGIAGANASLYAVAVHRVRKKKCGLSCARKIESLSKVDLRGGEIGCRYIIVFSEY